jgi:hypothetical protein
MRHVTKQQYSYLICEKDMQHLKKYITVNYGKGSTLCMLLSAVVRTGPQDNSNKRRRYTAVLQTVLQYRLLKKNTLRAHSIKS